MRKKIRKNLSLHFRNREKLMITHPTFTNYIVLRDGTIMNKTNGKIMKHKTNKKGYWVVSLRKNKKSYYRGVHRLILQTYNPIENDHLYHAHHIDEVRHHNHIGNLRWELIEDHLREHKKGKVLSEETRRKLSESHKGKVLSEETRRKMSESRKGKVLTEETRRRMSESLKGLRHTEEARRKISESLKGKVLSEETKKKMSEAKRNMSDETRRKMSEARKGMLFWNDGTKTIKSKECPGDGWTRGRM
jgi:hypothetical protein